MLRVPCIASGLVAVLAACQGPPPQTADLTCRSTVVIAPEHTDMLFVIDNSGSMGEEQAQLARELGAFVGRLAASAVRQDVQVGIVTTSVYQRLAGQPTVFFDTQGPLGPAQAGRLQTAIRPDGSKTPKLLRHGDLGFAEDFALAVQVGTRGSGQETPFEAVRLALGAPLIDTPLDQGGNDGLLRYGARLVVVVVTDEDDCSEVPQRNGTPSYDGVVGPDPAVDYCDNQRDLLTPPAEYRDLWRTLAVARGTRDVLLGAIAPVDIKPPHLAEPAPPPPVRARGCPTSFGVGRRLRAMAHLADPAGTHPDAIYLDSICNPSFQETLVRIADAVQVTPTLELSAPPPDGRMLFAEIHRADGATVDSCSDGNGLHYVPAAGDAKATITFEGTCERRADDRTIDLKLLCVD